ncbi:hypothetical protein BDW67DRAFT_171596 [Aspergillus spinulosporus]
MTTLTESMSEVFTPPTDCSTSWTYEGSYYNSVKGGLLLQNAFATNTHCFPDGFRNSGRAEGNLVYSPGYCADGYTSAALSFKGATTTVVCCPSDFSYYTTLTTPNGFDQTYIFAGCLSTYPAASPATVVPARAGNFDITTSTVSGPITMWGQPITVAYEESDLPLFITTTTATSTARALLSTATNSAQSSDTGVPETTAVDEIASSDAEESSAGLSTGAKAGIGAGAAAAGVIIFALLFLLFRRSRHRTIDKGAAAGLNGYQHSSGAPHSHTVSEVAGWPSPEREIPEMEGTKSMPNPYSNAPHELQG